jgi:hypothetical protein
MSTAAVPLIGADLIPVVPWPDPILDAIGHDPRSPYVEHFWLPVLGPTTVWLLRRLMDQLDRSPDGFEASLVELAEGLGLAHQTARSGPFANALVRCVQFGAAQHYAGGLAVRRRLPFLPDRQLQRFSPAMRAAHEAFIARDDQRTATAQRKRAYSLALTLARLGESADEIAWQLEQWRFSPALALDAATWAGSRTAGPDESQAA